MISPVKSFGFGGVSVYRRLPKSERQKHNPETDKQRPEGIVVGYEFVDAADEKYNSSKFAENVEH
jgi:hypothetical protein